MHPCQNQIVQKLYPKVKKILLNEPTGHDWYHTYRVYQMAKKIGKKEKANLFIIELAALTHELIDYKINPDEKEGIEKVKQILNHFQIGKDTLNQVIQIISNLSFRSSFHKGKIISKVTTLEGQIVQDADRLDALGAIGIARAFAYGGFHKQPIYDPHLKTKSFKSKKEYLSQKTSTLNHFYEKLLLLKDLMHTREAKKIAKKRHKFLKLYLKRFFAEWNLKP